MNEVKQARKEEFSKRFHIFQKKEEVETKEEPFDPTKYIEAEGNAPYQNEMMALHAALTRLEELGASRSTVQRTVNTFMKQVYGPSTNVGRGLSRTPIRATKAAR